MEASEGKRRKKKAAAKSQEEREHDLINAAYAHAEKQFANGTASSQITTHFLQLGSEKERLQTVKMEYEIKLLEAKTDAIKSAERIEKIYIDALKAMSRYRGDGDVDDYVEGEVVDDENLQ